MPFLLVSAVRHTFLCISILIAMVYIVIIIVTAPTSETPRRVYMHTYKATEIWYKGLHHGWCQSWLSPEHIGIHWGRHLLMLIPAQSLSRQRPSCLYGQVLYQLIPSRQLLQAIPQHLLELLCSIFRVFQMLFVSLFPWLTMLYSGRFWNEVAPSKKKSMAMLSTQTSAVMVPVQTRQN